MKSKLTMTALAATMAITTVGSYQSGVAHADTNTKAGETSKDKVKGDTSKPIDFKKAQEMSPKERVKQLTKEDKKLHNKESEHNKNESKELVSQQYSYPNVNKYIANNNIKHASIKEDVRIDNLPKYSYKSGKYVGVAIHETANPNSSLDGEVNYMYNNWGNAFVHAYADGNQIRQTAPADYLAWGAGANANPYFYQIELVRAHSFNEFARSVNNQAYLTAYMLKRNGLTPKLADTHGGSGTVISHNAISRYYGGSDHTDPVAYFSQWGYSMNQFYDLVQKHYNALSGKSTQDKSPSKITGSTYTVKHGDTLYDIAQRSGQSIDNIKKWSGIKSNVLYTGQVLKLKDSQSNKITSKTYEVSKKDTLYSISKRSGKSISDIKKWNNLKSDNIMIGQKLYLAPTHTVKKGETLYKISKDNNTSVSKLKTLNGLTKDTIKVGQKLILK